MADPETFRDAFLYGLRDTFDAERQFCRALPTLVDAAWSPELQSAFDSCLEDARMHIARLERVFGLLGEDARATHCERVAGILEEGMAMLGEEFASDAMDAWLIACVRRVQDYQLASYRTLVPWGAAMRHPDVARLLRQTLEEEKGASDELCHRAARGVAVEFSSDRTEIRDRDDAPNASTMSYVMAAVTRRIAHRPA